VPLVDTGDIVQRARSDRRAALAFNVIQLEHAEALCAAAERAGTGVVLQLSENTARYHRSLAPIAGAVLALAAAAQAPVAVHLDHCTDQELLDEALDLGIRSVMFDASAEPYEENVRRTRAVVAHCHARGVWVEAELGEVGGKNGVHAPGARTDPGEAARYVADTGVDGLAVAVGSSHAMTSRTAELDLDLIAKIHELVPVPLVLHGSSGVSDELIDAAVGRGMTKINIATHLNKAFTAAVRQVLEERPDVVDTRTYLGPGREAVSVEAARLLTLLAAPR
jgi:fructose-bisphosphate aldolase, class II